MSTRCWSGRRRLGARGYTLVELMMALALFTVSMLGIISMQKMVVSSNVHAKNLAIAERIARSWGTHLQLDSTRWNAAGLSGWLNDAAKWQRPAYDSTRVFGAAFDALGNPLTDSSADVANAHFCTHVRMSWLYPNNGAVTGSGMLRAEIRVFWLREGEATLGNTASICGAQTEAQVKNIGTSADRYHFVYQTVGLRQHFQI
jgi:prepilin-type N-terminal cleavage/methylation domain-containing protein